MKLGILATMGTSPPVVSEFIDYVERLERVSDLRILATAEGMVKNSALLAKIAVSDKYPHIKTRIEELPMKDITTEEENLAFMRKTMEVIADMRRGEIERLYVCLAGGRKEMVASLVLLTQLTNVEALYHVVSPNVKEMNVALERIRSNIEALAAHPDPSSYYAENRAVFEPVMYPDPATYNVIRIPVLPYPPALVQKLKSVFAKGYVRRASSGLDYEFLQRLKDAGFVSMTREKVIVTDSGRSFYENVLRYL